MRVIDTDNLLGRGEDLGITVVLVPADHPASRSAAATFSGAAFPNGPIWGRDVFIPIDWVIGGEKMVGQGWRMLMECLAAGRSISSCPRRAPSRSCATPAYARIRKQFDLPIGKMEGLERRSPAWSRTPT